MKMITPPECSGQMVIRSYGSDCAGTVYMRTEDLSDAPEERIRWYSADADSCGCNGECDCFNPSNRAPSNKIFAWVPCDDPERG